ncbi:MAG: hypothetical protein EBT73_03360 [Actinobacteria bacterium]|nr:hypothetical protein [Actinomycetota bacterium]
MKVNTIKKAIAVVFAAALVAPFGLGSQASAKDGDGRQINERPIANLKQGGTFRFVQVDICPNFNTSAIEGNLLNCSQVMNTMLPRQGRLQGASAGRADCCVAQRRNRLHGHR